MFDLFGNRLASCVKKTFQEEYTEYIKSSKWRKRANAAIKRAGEKCERCGMSKYTSPLEVHHRTYEHFKNETPEDLEVVCRNCHKKADRERAANTRARQAERLYDARLDGWASKVFGDDWRHSVGDERAELEFDSWLEKHGG